jgi:hypothetical protein
MILTSGRYLWKMGKAASIEAGSALVSIVAEKTTAVRSKTPSKRRRMELENYPL